MAGDEIGMPREQVQDPPSCGTRARPLWRGPLRPGCRYCTSSYSLAPAVCHDPLAPASAHPSLASLSLQQSVPTKRSQGTRTPESTAPADMFINGAQGLSPPKMSLGNPNLTQAFGRIPVMGRAAAYGWPLVHRTRFLGQAAGRSGQEASQGRRHAPDHPRRQLAPSLPQDGRLGI